MVEGTLGLLTPEKQRTKHQLPSMQILATHPGGLPTDGAAGCCAFGPARGLGFCDAALDLAYMNAAAQHSAFWCMNVVHAHGPFGV